MAEAIERSTRENPVKFLLGLIAPSMREFERIYGVSHSALMQLNAGGFKEPLDRVVNGLHEELVKRGLNMDDELAQAYGTSNLDSAYSLWKKMHRERWASSNAFPRVVAQGKTRPVKRWVDDGWGGPTAFAKALAVPYTMSLNWYRGSRRGVPTEIRRALDDADFDWRTLEDAERRWRERAASKGGES